MPNVFSIVRFTTKPMIRNLNIQLSNIEHFNYTTRSNDIGRQSRRHGAWRIVFSIIAVGNRIAGQTLVVRVLAVSLKFVGRPSMRSRRIDPSTGSLSRSIQPASHSNLPSIDHLRSTLYTRKKTYRTRKHLHRMRYQFYTHCMISIEPITRRSLVACHRACISLQYS